MYKCTVHKCWMKLVYAAEIPGFLFFECREPGCTQVKPFKHQNEQRKNPKKGHDYGDALKFGAIRSKRL